MKWIQKPQLKHLLIFFLVLLILSPFIFTLRDISIPMGGGDEPSETYLPLIYKQSKKIITGVQLAYPPRWGLQYVPEGVTVRRSIAWDRVETVQGVYDWSKYDENLLIGDEYILLMNINMAPGWASTCTDKRCCPPTEEHYKDWVHFAKLVVDRYEPDILEIGNEPDWYKKNIGVYDGFVDCWGRGWLYGEFLNYVYPRLKSKYPDLIIAGGSLLLEDDGKFWKDTLAVTGNSYDVMSFHAYAYFGGTKHGENNINNLRFKAKLLRRIGETKPLWVTETSLLCNIQTHDCDEEFLLAQADYFDYAIKSCKKYDVDVMIWFTLCASDWLLSDFGPKCGNWRPSYFRWLDYLEGGYIKG